MVVHLAIKISKSFSISKENALLIENDLRNISLEVNNFLTRFFSEDGLTTEEHINKMIKITETKQQTKFDVLKEVIIENKGKLEPAFDKYWRKELSLDVGEYDKIKGEIISEINPGVFRVIDSKGERKKTKTY